MFGCFVVTAIYRLSMTVSLVVFSKRVVCNCAGCLFLVGYVGFDVLCTVIIGVSTFYPDRICTHRETL